MARMTLTLDSATADEARDFILAFQKIEKGDLPSQINLMPAVTVMGPWSWNVTLPAIFDYQLVHFTANIPEWEKELMGASSPNSAD